MKKISVVLVILIIFNFIYLSFLPINVYAESGGASSGYFTIDKYKAMSNEGIATVNGEPQKIDLGMSDVGTALGILAGGSMLSSYTILKTISYVVNRGGFYYTESDYSAENTGIFTINSLIFGEYLLFNNKAYEKSTDLNEEITPTKITKTVDSIKETASTLSKFFVKLGLAIALPLITLAIIRTLSAKRVADLAAWKKILVRWALCIFLMIFYPYILSIIDLISDAFMEMFWNIRLSLEGEGYKAFEITAEKSIIKLYIASAGVLSWGYAIMFLGIVVMQMLFLIKYTIRTFSIIFMYIIAPIVMLMHSFNLMLGKRCDMLGEFFKTYIFTVLMQPLHALFYILFLFTLSEMALKAPALGILLLYGIYRAEGIAKAMFGWQLSTSLFSKK